MANLAMWKFEENEVGQGVKDGEVWFVAKDVCDVLGIVNSRDATNRLREKRVKGVVSA